MDAACRADEDVVGVVVGGRARVRATALVDSRSRQRPMTSASRTIIQPVGVIQVVSTMFVPGS